MKNVFPEALVAHNPQQDLSAQQGTSGTAQVTVSTNPPTHQQVPNNRVEFVQHHNIDMVNHMVTLWLLAWMLAIAV